MSIKLHNLRPAAKKKRRKRIGRGNASGHGSYSGRGIKGQKARSGVGGLKLKGMKHIILATPKLKGFKSIHLKAQIITLDDLEAAYQNGEIVNPENLFLKKIIDDKNHKVKILATGKLSKKLVILGCGVSAGAKAAIEAAGGKVE